MLEYLFGMSCLLFFTICDYCENVYGMNYDNQKITHIWTLNPYEDVKHGNGTLYARDELCATRRRTSHNSISWKERRII